MSRYRVTDRTTPKIHGKLWPPGSELALHAEKDYLIIDQLMETGSITLAPVIRKKNITKKTITKNSQPASKRAARKKVRRGNPTTK